MRLGPGWYVGSPKLALCVSLLVLIMETIVWAGLFRLRRDVSVLLLGCSIPMQIVQVAVCIHATLRLVKRLPESTLLDGWYMWGCTTLTFAGIYALLNLTLHPAFRVAADLQHGNNPHHGHSPQEGPEVSPLPNDLDTLAVLFYFSVTTQTTAGLGDISPYHPIVQYLAALQMLLGILFEVFIIGATVGRLADADQILLANERAATAAAAAVAAAEPSAGADLVRLARRTLSNVTRSSSTTKGTSSAASSTPGGAAVLPYAGTQSTPLLSDPGRGVTAAGREARVTPSPSPGPPSEDGSVAGMARVEEEEEEEGGEWEAKGLGGVVNWTVEVPTGHPSHTAVPVARPASPGQRRRDRRSRSAIAAEWHAELWHRLTHAKRVQRTRRFLRRFLLPMSILIQGVTFGAQYALDPNMFHRSDASVRNISWCALSQAVQLIGIVVVSFKFVRHFDDRSITLVFLSQSYLSIALAFAGLHALLFAASPGSYHLIKFERGENNKDLFRVISQFVYYSICVMTRTGYGDIYPRTLAARLLTSIQMITTVAIMVVVFGRGLRSFEEARDHSVVGTHRHSRSNSAGYHHLPSVLARRA